MLATSSDLSYFMRCRKRRPLGKKSHPFCFVFATPGKERLTDDCDQRKHPFRCHRKSLQGSTASHFVGSHNGNGFREKYLQDVRTMGTNVLFPRSQGYSFFCKLSEFSGLIPFCRAKVLRMGETSSAA